MKPVLLVGLGGFAGSVARYAAGGLVHRFLPGALFPWGTFAVNLAGCFAIGVMGGLAEVRGLFGPEARLALFVGLLGGFTTFSSFGFETWEMFRDRQLLAGAGNVALHVGGGLAAVAAGHLLAQRL
ncbi:MAG: fluoride efflux transporter CrcB [Acidobacteria bacterium]|nr:MAG: fluoride efflux transporter CrcB [Acidobacteriota bacterium]